MKRNNNIDEIHLLNTFRSVYLIVDGMLVHVYPSS